MTDTLFRLLSVQLSSTLFCSKFSDERGKEREEIRDENVNNMFYLKPELRPMVETGV